MNDRKKATSGAESFLKFFSFDDLIEGCQILDFEWRYRYVNQAVVSQSGYHNKEELLGFTLMEKYPGVENTLMYKALDHCMKKREKLTFENEFVFPDGKKRWFELRIDPIPKGVFIMSIDITDRKQNEAEKRAYIKLLEDLIFITSHKIRQPVCNLIGLVNLIYNFQNSKKEFKKLTNYLQEALQSLDRVTQDLTDFIHEQKIKNRY
ncbi:PAS domain-containing protein [bacterium]|nr:PAS domain-containing protein [bacterium]